jgi:hypothetical protein
MSRNEKENPPERVPEGSEDKTDAAQRLARFARYTAPAMLAILAAGGNAAVAAS